jgi:DNA-binding NtrC family response regulator
VIQASLEQNGGDVRAVAQVLGMTTRAVYQKLSYHGFGNNRDVTNSDI